MQLIVGVSSKYSRRIVWRIGEKEEKKTYELPVPAFSSPRSTIEVQKMEEIIKK